MAPAKKHEFTKAEIKAGVMVVAALAVFALFTAAISGLRPPADENRFVCYFDDVSGLNPSADVRFGGTKVGRVENIDLDPDKRKLVVNALVDAGVPVNADSVAMITTATLTSEKHLEITTGSQHAGLLEDGAEIDTVGGGMFEQIEKLATTLDTVGKDIRDLLGAQKFGDEDLVSVADLFQELDKTAKNATGLVGDARGVVSESKDDVQEILDRLKNVEEAAEEMLSEVNGILEENRGSIRSAIGNADQFMADLQPVAEQVSELVDKLATRIDTVATSLQSTLDNAESLSDEAQGVLQDNRELIDDTIDDLNETVSYLKEFARLVSEQPQALLRGSAPAGRE